MSEAIYIKETKEFWIDGLVIKEADLSKSEIKELKQDCNNVSKLFGAIDNTEALIKG